jgi:hypothetical protein
MSARRCLADMLCVPCRVCAAGFADLPRDCLETLLRSNKLSADEGEIWSAVDKWAASRLRRAGKKPDGPGKREVLGDLLYLVRFPLIEMTELCTKVQPSGVLAQDELLALFTYAGAPEEAKPKTPFSARERSGGGSSKVVVEEFEWSREYSNPARVTCMGSRVQSIAPTCNRDVLAVADVKGWSKGVHYWRVHMANAGCIRRVGVVDGDFDKTKYGGDANYSAAYPPVLGQTAKSWGIPIGSPYYYVRCHILPVHDTRNAIDVRA